MKSREGSVLLGWVHHIQYFSCKVRINPPMAGLRDFCFLLFCCFFFLLAVVLMSQVGIEGPGISLYSLLEVLNVFFV